MSARLLNIRDFARAYKQSRHRFVTRLAASGESADYQRGYLAAFDALCQQLENA